MINDNDCSLSGAMGAWDDEPAMNRGVSPLLALPYRVASDADRQRPEGALLRRGGKKAGVEVEMG